MRLVRLCAAACAVIVLTGPARADEITVNGHAYKDVLITKTESFYYVQLPEEGRTLSLRPDQVDVSSVKINDDPYYRTPLRDTYTANKARRAAGEIKDVDPAFRAGPAGGGAGALSLDDVRGAGGGAGGGAGFGIARTAVEQTLAGFGFQFQPGPGNTSAIAKDADGSLELLGPPESLTGLVVKAAGPVQAVDAGAQQLQMLLMQLKPDAASAYAGALTEAKQKGSASVSMPGLGINISRKVDGANASIEVRLSAGG